MKKIIDVSEHQKRIDWTKVSGVDGVIIRIGYGDDEVGQDDDYVKYNLDEVERLGIPYEVYFYSYANCERQKLSEIAHVKRLIAGRNIKRIWLDLEYRPAQDYWRRMTEAFLQAFPGSGVYSWEWVFTDVLDGIECPRWICAYGDNTGEPEYGKKPRLSCHGWQYTSRAKMSGINGYVDASEWYGDFAEAPARLSAAPTTGRNAVVNQMLAWEHFSEQNGKFKIIIDGYNDYLPTAVKAGCANYAVKYSDEWCATCASNAYIACGIGYLFPVECSCPRMITLVKSMGIWQENDGYVPDPADAVLYDWEDSGKGDNAGTPDHIGIVIAVDKSKGTFVVMEGNKNESVERRTMSIDGKYIRGFITPKFNDSVPVPAKKEEAKTVAKTYEISKTGAPNKTTCVKWGLLKNNQRVTPRLQPDESAKPCSFSPVQPLMKIEVYDYITTAKRWAYCKVSGKYGFILASSISAYLRTPKQSMDKVVDWVLADDFGKNATRENALKALGYDADAVQKAVNDKFGYKAPEKADSPRIRVWPVWFFEGNEELFGDCTAILEYNPDNTIAHCILIDTAIAGASGTVIRKLQKAGVKRIDAVVISHGHGDHYGGLSNIIKAIPVEHIYVPDTAGLDKYQKSYASAIRSQAKKAPSTTLKAGSAFQIGSIKCQCIYQVPADKLKEHDNHHFVNNQSVVLRFTLGDWTYHTAGDLQNEGNNVLVKAVSNLQADIYKTQWHGDANACNETICKAVCPKIAFSNYHHKEGSGRGTTRKRLEAVGAVVARNSENGDIYIDCQGETMKLSCSKGNLSRTFVKKKLSYKVSLTTKVKASSGSGLLAIEPEDYTAAEVQELKHAGYTMLAYLSVGSVSDERPYYKQLEKYTLRKLDDWEHERYLDVCEKAVQDWLINRGMALLNAGYDGIWADNIDVYEEYPSDTAYKGITRILQALYPHGYIMINGGMEYVSKAIANHARVAHGVTQEEVFSRITDYSDSGTFGAQTGAQSRAYQKYIATALSNGMDAYLLEYTRDSKIKDKIVQYCTASGAGYYISEDVDL